MPRLTSSDVMERAVANSLLDCLARVGVVTQLQRIKPKTRRMIVHNGKKGHVRDIVDGDSTILGTAQMAVTGEDKHESGGSIQGEPEPQATVQEDGPSAGGGLHAPAEQEEAPVNRPQQPAGDIPQG